MAGGVAVRANLLCVTWSAARGHVFLFDLEARRPMSTWTVPNGDRGWSDAAGVAMDEHFHLFVADPHNDRVCHFSAFGRHLGDLGTQAPDVGDQARDRPGVLDRPHAVALLGDTVLVACGDRARRRGVQRFSKNGDVLRPLASGGDVEATFAAPRGIHADPELDIGGNAERLLRSVECAVLLSHRTYRPRTDAVAAVTTAWTPEAERRMERVPEFARKMARMAILQFARERGHTVITERIVDDATAALCPGHTRDRGAPGAGHGPSGPHE